jgi:AraC-like DNA-binding protein
MLHDSWPRIEDRGGGGMDVLSDVLDTVRLTSTVFVQTRLSAPWGIRSRPREHFAFHVVSTGGCWLDVDELPGAQVGAGDVVVLAPGRGHTLRSTPDAIACDAETLVADGALGCDRDGDTSLVCGSFRFDSQAVGLLAALPPVLHIRQSELDIGPWLAHTIDLLTYESFANRPGNTTVVNRLCDALFIYLLRCHFSSGPTKTSGWMCALDDPQIGAALALMHAEPQQPWSVPALATSVGMSRSAFAARFADLVGESPIHYLALWRVQKAAAMLRDADTSIDDIATRVGYESAVAFSKAFKRSMGVPPGAYRRFAR